MNHGRFDITAPDEVTLLILHRACFIQTRLILTSLNSIEENNRFYDGVEAETRKSQTSFHIIQVSSEAVSRMRLE